MLKWPWKLPCILHFRRFCAHPIVEGQSQNFDGVVAVARTFASAAKSAQWLQEVGSSWGRIHSAVAQDQMMLTSLSADKFPTKYILKD